MLQLTAHARVQESCNRAGFPAANRLAELLASNASDVSGVGMVTRCMRSYKKVTKVFCPRVGVY
jgi:hypothetical protein